MIAVRVDHHWFWIGRVLAVGCARDSKNACQIAQSFNIPSAHSPIISDQGVPSFRESGRCCAIFVGTEQIQLAEEEPYVNTVAGKNYECRGQIRWEN